MALILESAILQLIAITGCVGNFPARGTTAGILFRSESREDGQTGEIKLTLSSSIVECIQSTVNRGMRDSIREGDPGAPWTAEQLGCNIQPTARSAIA